MPDTIPKPAHALKSNRMNWRKIIIPSVMVAVIYGMITYAIVHHVSQSAITSDSLAHAEYVIHYWIDGNFNEFISHVTYPIWHIVFFVFFNTFGASEIDAIAAASSLFGGITAIVVYCACVSFLNNKKVPLAIACTVILLFVTAIWLPFFNNEVYLGQGSPTVWHNPTYNAVKPFALLTVLLFVDSMERQCLSPRKAIAISLLLLLTVFAKPVFFQIFFPSTVIYAIAVLIKSHDLRIFSRILLILLPASFVVLFQARLISGGAGAESWIVFNFFEVLSVYTPNLLVSLILLLAFPLYVLTTSFIKKDKYSSRLCFPAIMLVVSFCEAAFLAEGGARHFDGNFIWGFMLAVFIVWVYALPVFINGIHVKEEGGNSKLVVGFVLVIAHFASGIYYLIHLLMTNVPF